MSPTSRGHTSTVACAQYYYCTAGTRKCVYACVASVCPPPAVCVRARSRSASSGCGYRRAAPTRFFGVLDRGLPFVTLNCDPREDHFGSR